MFFNGISHLLPLRMPTFSIYSFSTMSEYRYVPSCELQKPVILRISSLLGSFDRCSRRPLLPDMCVRVKVYCNQRLVGPEVQTEYRPPCPPSLRGERHRWGEVLELPIRYSELSEDAFLLITLWAADRNHGEVHFQLFSCC